MAITFHRFPDNCLRGEKKRIKKWIESTALSKRKKTGTLAFFICSDEELVKINKEFLQHSTYTDIITFDYSSSTEISGEIYISWERVKENAQKFTINAEEELKRVLIHGVLHLCGLKDKTEKEKKTMRKQENAALKLYHQMV